MTINGSDAPPVVSTGPGRLRYAQQRVQPAFRLAARSAVACSLGLGLQGLQGRDLFQQRRRPRLVQISEAPAVVFALGAPVLGVDVQDAGGLQGSAQPADDVPQLRGGRMQQAGAGLDAVELAAILSCDRFRVDVRCPHQEQRADHRRSHNRTRYSPTRTRYALRAVSFLAPGGRGSCASPRIAFAIRSRSRFSTRASAF